MAKDKVKDKRITSDGLENETKKEETKKVSNYFYGIGKRKTSIAQVRIYPGSSSQSEIFVNERKMEEYFSVSRLKDMAKSRLSVSGQDKKFDVKVKVNGGGMNSQAEAIRLGISRALVKFDNELKKPLRDKGYITRDARKVERKKPGLKKARRSPQWAKR